VEVTALALSLEWVNSDLSDVVFLFGGMPCVHLSIRVQSTLSKSEVMKRETTTESVIGIVWHENVSSRAKPTCWFNRENVAVHFSGHSVEEICFSKREEKSKCVPAREYIQDLNHLQESGCHLAFGLES